jgi:hypothetical protein
MENRIPKTEALVKISASTAGGVVLGVAISGIFMPASMLLATIIGGVIGFLAAGFDAIKTESDK